MRLLGVSLGMSLLIGCGPGEELCEDGSEPQLWYVDLDGDGAGDHADAGVSSCEPIPDRVGSHGDCDDEDPDVEPGQAELCNDIDDDCDPSNDLELGTVAVNGRRADDLQAAVQDAVGDLEIGFCGGEHEISGLELPESVSSLTLQGLHATEPSLVITPHRQEIGLPHAAHLIVRDVQVDGDLVVSGPPRTGDLTLERVEFPAEFGLFWSGFGTARLSEISGSGHTWILIDRMELSDADMRALTLSANQGYAEQVSADYLDIGGVLLLRDSVVRPGGALNAGGSVTLERVSLVDLDEVYLGSPDRMQMISSPIVGGRPVEIISPLELDETSHIAGLEVRDATLFIEGMSEVRLTDLVHVGGSGIVLKEDVGLTIVDGRIEGHSRPQAGAIHLEPDGTQRLVLRDTQLLGNGTERYDVAIITSDAEDHVTLEQVQNGSEDQPNQGPLVQHGDIVWDGHGTVSVACAEGRCSP